MNNSIVYLSQQQENPTEATSILSSSGKCFVLTKGPREQTEKWLFWVDDHQIWRQDKQNRTINSEVDDVNSKLSKKGNNR